MKLEFSFWQSISIVVSSAALFILLSCFWSFIIYAESDTDSSDKSRERRFTPHSRSRHLSMNSRMNSSADNSKCSECHISYQGSFRGSFRSVADSVKSFQGVSPPRQSLPVPSVPATSPAKARTQRC